jgi:hypothetical protein
VVDRDTTRAAAFEAAHRQIQEVTAAAPRRRLTGVWDFVVRGSRPVGLWIANLILLTHYVVLPIAEAFWHVRYRPLTGLELAGVCTLLGLGWHQRTQEKQAGLTT